MSERSEIKREIRGLEKELADTSTVILAGDDGYDYEQLVEARQNASIIKARINELTEQLNPTI